MVKKVWVVRDVTFGENRHIIKAYFDLESGSLVVCDNLGQGTRIEFLTGFDFKWYEHEKKIYINENGRLSVLSFDHLCDFTSFLTCVENFYNDKKCVDPKKIFSPYYQ